MVYFLAYFCLERPIGERDPEDNSPHQMYWVLLHFPFVLGLILLLLGMLVLRILNSTYAKLRSIGLKDHLLVMVRVAAF